MKSFGLIADAKEQFLISAKAASAWLGISAFTIYSWALSHRIPHYKIGKRVMFSKEDLKRWLDGHRVGETE